MFRSFWGPNLSFLHLKGLRQPVFLKLWSQPDVSDLLGTQFIIFRRGRLNEKNPGVFSGRSLGMKTLEHGTLAWEGIALIAPDRVLHAVSWYLVLGNGPEHRLSGVCCSEKCPFSRCK